jgi:hypothetical protein
MTLQSWQQNVTSHDDDDDDDKQSFLTFSVTDYNFSVI